MRRDTSNSRMIEEVDVGIFEKDFGFDLECKPLNITRREVKQDKKTYEAPGDRNAGHMRALAIDTSLKKDRNVAGLLGPFIDGMREAGAEVEHYFARDLTIFPCCGNLNCTVRTPGKCMAYDDMRWLRKKIARADVLVLASPLYFNGTTGPEGVTASLMSLQQKLAPGKKTPVDMPYGHALHTTREVARLRKVVIASCRGFWEVEGLNPALTHLKAFCMNSYPGFDGNIPEPRGAILRGELKDGVPWSEIVRRAREAGRRTVLNEQMERR